MSTPKEAYSGKKPDLSHLRIFGANVYMHVTKDASRSTSVKRFRPPMVDTT